MSGYKKDKEKMISLQELWSFVISNWPFLLVFFIVYSFFIPHDRGMGAGWYIPIVEIVKDLRKGGRKV